MASNRKPPTRNMGTFCPLLGPLLLLISVILSPANGASSLSDIEQNFLQTSEKFINSLENTSEQTNLDLRAKVKASNYNPIVFIPGDGGSQLEAKLNKTKKVRYVCSLQSDWYDIWLNLRSLVYPFFDCFCDNLRLCYNSTTRIASNSQGVEIRPTNFGSLASVAYLDNANIIGTEYFEKIIATLEKKNGFKRDVEMVGAPFDFRLAPNQLGEFFTNLTKIIETQYVYNNFRPVTLICHSMGCLNSLYLLDRQTQSWKDVYVRRLISLAAPWSGSFKAISAMLYGDNLGIPLLSKYKLQKLQSSFPSLMYLFPRAPTYAEDRVLVETDTMNYTLKNLDKLFEDAGLIDQKNMWHDTRSIATNLSAPNVELWCLYGSGVDTPSKIIYNGSLDDNNYREIQGDGDGTVNLESLWACEHFQAHQQKPVYTRMFDGVDHISILRGGEVADFISSFILSGDSNDDYDDDRDHQHHLSQAPPPS